MKRALFPGTFDPPTLGHLDLIERATKTCDELFVGVANNLNKSTRTLFSVTERMEMLEKLVRAHPQVKICSFTGLVVEFAKKNQIHFLIRGLRAYSDFEYEFTMALANRKMGNIETVFLMADERLAHISATLIRELAFYQIRLHDFIPKEIEERVFKRLAEGRS